LPKKGGKGGRGEAPLIEKFMNYCGNWMSKKDQKWRGYGVQPTTIRKGKDAKNLRKRTERVSEINEKN